MLEICDIAYCIHVDRLWAQSVADQQSAATLIAAGAKADDVKAPSFEDRQRKFDEALAAEPQPESPAVAVFRELGLVA